MSCCQCCKAAASEQEELLPVSKSGNKKWGHCGKKQATLETPSPKTDGAIDVAQSDVSSVNREQDVICSKMNSSSASAESLVSLGPKRQFETASLGSESKHDNTSSESRENHKNGIAVDAKKNPKGFECHVSADNPSRHDITKAIAYP
ncbi:hypothetical protein QYM36_019858 [Artemia franciscana]|uniref:Uncharacterized protein n=1 Tax=Artemia franciscana TaxID=6661 RepID=A0AA88KST2_ARTSF|nr:hypothetical protein QYM36_019858 [Artemia franciscana]